MEHVQSVNMQHVLEDIELLNWQEGNFQTSGVLLCLGVCLVLVQFFLCWCLYSSWC